MLSPVLSCFSNDSLNSLIAMCLKNSDATDKAYFIKSYFEDLQRRIEFLIEFHGMERRDEALMLCCCYIEALGSRSSSEPKSKARNYCNILAENGNNEIWNLIHPMQLKNILSTKPLFKENLGPIALLIDGMGTQLFEPQEVIARLNSVLNEQQLSWLQENIFKGSMAYISYERIRSELVHDITGGSISFSSTTYKGNPVPDLNFEALYSSLLTIVAISRSKAVSTNKWWYEQ